uniref:Uncharacterized protein n=2 Tax=Avena sativa TaxID=4498 RepID=A0ACD5WDG4_AVESA
MYYKGWYHLFYQYNPEGAVWGNIVWGHSVSRDLINWVVLEPALRPSIKADKYGCWSGSATMLPDATPVIMYTGIIQEIKDWSYQVQNLAYPRNSSDPLLREWIKPASNPVIVPEGEMNKTLFRDPTTAWRADGLWRLLVGSREGTTRGVAYLYRSQDFKRWTRVRWPLHSGSTGMWECPDFYPVMVGGWQKGLDTSVPSSARVKHILKNSLDTRRYDYYTVGAYDCNMERYVPDNPAGDEHHLRYDYGNFYASKTFYDPSKQRRILWGWANESDTVDDDKAKGWAGIQAIPRKVWLEHGGKQLLQWPVEEVEALRGKLASLNDRVIKPGDSVEVTGIQTAQADVEVTFEVLSMEGMEALDPALAYDAQKLCSLWGADKGGVGPFGLWVLASAKLQEKTAVFFRVFRAVGRNNTKPVVLMCTDPTSSSLSPNLYRPTFAGFVDTDISQGKIITLRSLVCRRLA